MSQALKDFEKTGNAGESMTANQYYIVQLSAAGDIEVGEGATDLLVGVLQNKPASGEAALYRFAGTTKVVASAAVAIGAKLTTTAAGKAVTTTTAGDMVVGIALEAAAADGDIIEMQLMFFHYKA